MSIPNSYTEMHRIDLPRGKVLRHLDRTHQQSSAKRPDPCHLHALRREWLERDRRRPGEANGESGASATTLTNTYTTEWAAPFSVQLLCASNNGPGGQQALAEQMQITAITVASITTQP
jgi:hypothetical protein